MLIFALEKYSMERMKKHRLKIKLPVRGCVAFNFHWILSTNSNQGFSIIYLLSLLITSRKIEEILAVVYGIKQIFAMSDDFSTEWVMPARDI